ncbi:MAG: hypothetical protein MUE69_30460 [Myxococcota bacterium]|nr:hypothetical protein [Myxococcota bacterium]
MARPCVQGELDCHLGCAPGVVPYELVFDRREPCEIPAIPNQDGSRWPTLEELAGAFTRMDLAFRPIRLVIPRVISIAGRRNELCAVDAEGALHCWRA